MKSIRHVPGAKPAVGIVVTCLVFSGLAFLGGGAVAYEGVKVKGGGKVVGSVRFSGTPPPPETRKVTRDHKACGTEPKVSDALIVAPAGGLKNVVASLDGLERGKAFSDAPVELDQRRCWFHPRVVLVPAGKRLVLINNDGVLHNFRTPGTGKNPALNKAQPRFKKRLPITIKNPDIIPVNCDVHEWMRAVVVVMGHPYYALTDNDGTFVLSDVPPGRYTLTLWHEVLGKQSRDVVVPAGGEATVSVEFEGQ